MKMKITVTRLSSGFYHVRGVGPCNWAQPTTWPCAEEELRRCAFPEASEAFIRVALAESCALVPTPVPSRERAGQDPVAERRTR